MKIIIIMHYDDAWSSDGDDYEVITYKLKWISLLLTIIDGWHDAID